MTIAPDTHVADLAVRYPSTIPVLERYGLDYCCGGKRPLAEACRERALNVEAVQADLEAATADPAAEPAEGWDAAPLAALVDHIVARYHQPLRQDLDRVGRLLTKVLSRHGDRHPKMLPPLSDAFRALATDLLGHLQAEEEVLFPHVLLVERGLVPLELNLYELLPQLMREHVESGDLLGRMRSLTGGYTPPPDACPSFQALMTGLQSLETELHRHIHLENHVLFPRAAALEAALR